MLMDARTYARFIVKTLPTGVGGCWLWTAGKDRDGYGQFKMDGRVQKAHRVAYEHYVGPIPDGLQIDHLCRNRMCVNPDHLEPVTQQENIRRGNVGKNHSDKTHCPRGHEYDDANTYVRFDGNRECRKCHRDRERMRRREMRGRRGE